MNNFFSRDKMAIDMNMLVFFWENVLGPPQKPWLKALALLYLASGPLQNAANLGVVPT